MKTANRTKLMSNKMASQPPINIKNDSPLHVIFRDPYPPFKKGGVHTVNPENQTSIT